MRFDTNPGDTPLPVLEHALHDCRCGHPDEQHEEVEASAAGESKQLVICFECDADDEDLI